MRRSLLGELESEWRWALGKAEGDQETAACRPNPPRPRPGLAFRPAPAKRAVDPLGEPDDGSVAGVMAEKERGQKGKQGDEREQNLGHCSANLSESFKHS
jgi:hypothetical protein